MSSRDVVGGNMPRGMKTWLAVLILEIKIWKKYKHVIIPQLTAYPDMVNNLDELETLLTYLMSLNPPGPA